MSRSYKKTPIVKDRPRNHKKSSLYWRTVRRVQNQQVRMFKYKIYESYYCSWFSESESDDFLYCNQDELNIPHQKVIVNDYDYCDYWFFTDKIRK